ncbi:MAG: dihydrofolate reductase [Nanoarchaeota archaeon]|nr:dihydrofolate reductase [Nanoarchaeota archaeon]
MNLEIIAAVAKNGTIGKEGKMPWRNEPWVRKDLERFKTLTLGNPTIMGRKTYESIGKPLPNRPNIVVTRNPQFPAPEEVILAKNLIKAVQKAYDLTNKEPKKAYIIGGQEIYQEALPFVNTMHLTEIHSEYEGDTFFPEFSKQDWNLEFREEHEEFDFCKYTRKEK